MALLERISGLKYHKEPIEKIRNLRKSRWGKLSAPSSPLDGIKAYLKPDKRSFRIEFQYNLSNPVHRSLKIGQHYRNVDFKYGDNVIEFNPLYLGTHSPPTFKGTIDQFHTKGFSKKKSYYHRLFIPLESEINFGRQITQAIYESDLGIKSRNATKAIINGSTVSICIVSANRATKKSESFMVIESDKKCRHSEFDKQSHAVMVGIGYLFGFYVGGQGYHFVYEKPEMKDYTHFSFSELRDSIKSGYTPINSNPHSYLYGNRKLAKKYTKILREVTLQEFSTLCQRLYDSTLLSSTIMLMIESSIASLRFMPGGFAIALESLSDIILGDTKPKLAPIKDKPLSRLIRDECKKVIQARGSTLDKEDLDAVLGRIDYLNQPTNKALLKAPFDLLRIELLPEDEAILKVRNDLLHGRIPDITNKGDMRSERRKSKDLYYSGMRLYTLLNMLILKWIGYDNRVLNHAKIQSSFTQIKLKEEVFRQV